jgi:EmrB/QacA subfamily drug resistance transporter
LSSTAKRVLLVLAAAQFLMVLDQAVMNVSISQLVADFDTDVTTIQAVITFYSLVMAALMITGGKLGDRWGRKRAFTIGMVVYAAGSALTAVSWTVGSLALGWSVLEGIGAALVLPAMVALVATNFEGRARAAAFGVLGGVAGAGIAVGPILGGWMTTNLSWRLVFAGEVVIAIGILLGVRFLTDEAREGPPTEVDWVGSALSAAGLGLIVFGVLQSSSWGFLRPRNSPLEPFGFSLTPFVIGAGAVVLALFVQWQHHREQIGREPLVRLEHLKIPALRSGLSMFLAQNLILMGIFFTIPLYLQIVQGFDAFETGLRMLPVSVTLFLTATLAPRLAARVSPKRIVRVGLVVLLVACFFLLSVIDPDIDTGPFLAAMAVLGIGMGLLASQLGNVVQSSVDEASRSEAGGLQFTAQQLGAALGTALMGAIVIGGLATSVANTIESDTRISDATKQQTSVQLEAGVPFVPASEVRAAADEAGLPPGETDAIVHAYEESQLDALKAGLLFAAFVVLVSFLGTRSLPSAPLEVPDAIDDTAAPTG